MRGKDSQVMIRSWIKGAAEARISSALLSLYHKLLWVLTMEFLSLQQRRLNFLLRDMSWRMLLLCFPKERHIYLYSLYASVFKSFGHNAWLQPNLIEILMFHGHRNQSREWRPSRENSCRVCPHFIRLQKNLHIQLQAELTPNHNSAPKQNSTGNRFQRTVHLEVVDCWKRRGSKAQVWPLNFP